MKTADKNYVVIGKIGSTYGVRGWLKINAYTEFKTHIFNYSPWYLAAQHNQWDAIAVEDGRPHGNTLIAKLAGIETPEEGRLLTGKLIAVPRSKLPVLKQNEYYWSDLIGLTVINQHDEILGKVIYLMETGSNDVLVIKNDKEHAIPYLLGSVIINIDLTEQKILVNWELI